MSAVALALTAALLARVPPPPPREPVDQAAPGVRLAHPDWDPATGATAERDPHLPGAVQGLELLGQRSWRVFKDRYQVLLLRQFPLLNGKAQPLRVPEGCELLLVARPARHVHQLAGRVQLADCSELDPGSYVFDSRTSLLGVRTTVLDASGIRRRLTLLARDGATLKPVFEAEVAHCASEPCPMPEVATLLEASGPARVRVTGPHVDRDPDGPPLRRSWTWNGAAYVEQPR